MENSRSKSCPLEPSLDYSIREGTPANPEFPYRELIGSLLYLSTKTRPYISVGCNILAQHVNAPTELHRRGAIRILRYLNATKDVVMEIKPGASDQLSAHVDASWAAEKGSERRSRSGIAIFYGSALIFYKSSLQTCIATSSTEAEYVALSEATKIIMWLRQVLAELNIQQKPTVVHEDNTGAIAWAEDNSGKQFSKSRHIDVRYHIIKEKIRDSTIKLERTPTEQMKADFLTKILPEKNLRNAMSAIGLRPISSEKGVLT